MAQTIEAVRRQFAQETELATLIKQLRSEDRMRPLGLQQLDHLVDALQQDNESVASLPAIISISNLRELGRDSHFYAQSQTIFNKMRREGLTEKELHRDWMGRTSQTE